MTKAVPHGIPDSSEYPRAAAFPDSGTPVTRSASTGESCARNLPALILLAYTLTPSIWLSGLAKYMYSKMHLASFSFGRAMLISDSIPPAGVIVITSPGNTSLMNSAPIVSSAQVSDVTI